MSLISDEYLERLRGAVLVSEVVGRGLRLTRAGKGEYKACCPFHHEKTASFTVNDDKGFFHCFGCGAHGDALGFLARADNLTFPEAVEALAGIAGIEPPRFTPEQRAQENQRRDLYAALERATVWFQTRLHSEEGAPARGYLEGRGLTPETIERFRLGWAPDDFGALRRHLTDFGVEEEDAIAAGLLKRREPKPDGLQPAPYAAFRGRVMFPIGDRRGRVVGFGGRVLPGAPEDAPKYINSADGPLFHKGRGLYGLSRARRAAMDGQAVIAVEGFLDVIQLVQAGFDGAVAPLGTALTVDQLHLLWKLYPADAERRIPLLCFDGDKAGARAAARVADLALPYLMPGHSVAFLRLPEGEDPDSLVRGDGGADAFRALVEEQQRPLVEQLWAMATEGRRLDTPEDKAALAAWVEDRLAAITDAKVRAAYSGDLSGRLAKVLGSRPKLAVESRAKAEKTARGPDEAATRGDGKGRGGGQGPADPQHADEACPVVVLGNLGKVHSYLKARGDYFELTVREHTDAGLSALFGGNTDWLRARYPAINARGMGVGFEVGPARDWLFREADRLPPFDAVATLRGAGLWPDGEGGIIVHCGDEVRVGGQWRSAGCRLGQHVYPREPGLPAPAPEPGSYGDWQDLQAFLGTWNWEEPERDTLANIGWLANGMLAGVAPWHCALWVPGDSGAGKSGLLKLYRAVHGQGWAVAVSKPTEAAVRQSLGPAAKVVLIDEIENDELGHQARNVAELVRLATDPDQAATARGSPEGGPRSYPIRAVLYLTSILRPPLMPQDLNRLTICNLRAMEADPAAQEHARRETARFASLSARMRARMLARWPDFHRVRDVFAAQLAGMTHGPNGARHRARQLDQVGTLLTCAWLALNDSDPTAGEAAAWVRLFPPDDRAGVGDENSDPWQCLQHLLTSAPERRWVQNAHRRVTLAEMLNDLRATDHVPPYELGAYGLGIWGHPTERERCLVVANNHLGLEELFAGTRWAKGVWRQSLERLPGALKADKLLSFKGAKQRGVWLPIDRFVPDGRDHEDDPAQVG